VGFVSNVSKFVDCGGSVTQMQGSGNNYMYSPNTLSFATNGGELEGENAIYFSCNTSTNKGSITLRV
jgi:hypothetical protein